jgi:predicted ATP-binding protein involved in virulence
MQGLVLIDEIETHLHIDLQKKILPFLTSFFPKIQFIVTTHSPFVLTSIKDAVIYDLEHQEAIEDLSGYSVEAIIEGYFGSDKYSEALKAKVDEYEQLAKKDELSFSEEKRYKSLKKYFDDLSDVFAEELKLKIQQIRMLKPVK